MRDSVAAMSVRESNRGDGSRVVVTSVIVAAVFMANLDLWIVNVALPDLAQSLHGSLSGVSWVLNAYAVTLAALLVPAGRLGDRIGHKQVFLAGIALFTAASLACGLAPNLPVLVVARIAQAAGAAAQLPTSLALLMAGVPAARRTAAARSWAAVGALAAICGPVFGGLLVTVSWRWVFVVNLPIGVLAWVLGRRALPVEPPRERGPMPDLIGSVVLVGAVAALTGALVEAPTWGWLSARTLGLLVLAVAGALLFLRRCARHVSPMVELHLMKVPAFAVANAGTFVYGAAFAIMLLSNSLWCQEIWRYSALRTGLAMAPGPLMVPFVTFASARLVRRVGSGPVAAAGSVLFALAMLWRIVASGPGPDYVGDLLPSMLLGGIGVGLALGTLIAAGATALPPARAATGSAIVNSGRQIASALGVAVLVTVLGGSGSVGDYRVGWWVAAGLALLAAGISLALPRPVPVLLGSARAGSPHAHLEPA
jgi:EmrB/QacA subfamily drug resistance transporter